MDINEINKHKDITDLDVYVLSVFKQLYDMGEKEVSHKIVLAILRNSEVSYVPEDLSVESVHKIVTKLGTTLVQIDQTITENIFSKYKQLVLPIEMSITKDEKSEIEEIKYQFVGAPVSIADITFLEAMDRVDLV
ncbi:MAG: hypothetical protein HLX50_14195 [Alteromonadaceae bacterium]|nr:hypothetical protein [Alteromonadaceae bacterium]